jgi:hypothetical protein
MVFKFTGCCTALLLNFLYLFHQFLMFLRILLPLPLSGNIRLMHKSSGIWCCVTGQAVPSVCGAFTYRSKKNDVGPLTLMTNALQSFDTSGTTRPMTVSHPKGFASSATPSWHRSDLCEFYVNTIHDFFFSFSFFVILISGLHCDVNEICAFLGYYAALCGNCLLIFWNNQYVVPKYW